MAAAAALNGPQDCVDEIRAIYKSRRDVLVEKHGAGGLGHSRAASLDVRLGADAGEIPRQLGSMEFAKQLLIHAKVAVSPGIGFGEYGEGYVRDGAGGE